MEDKRKSNLDNVAKDILYKTLDKVTSSKIKMCRTAKEIWEKLIQLCEDNEQTKENKLSVAIQKFDNTKMKIGESMHDYDERISGIINELNTLGKVYSNKEISLKVVRGLSKERDVKTMAIRESKDLNKVEFHDLFADLKAYEFEMQIREGEPSTPAATTALTAVKLEPIGSVEISVDQLSNDAISQGNFQRQYQKNHSKEEPNACYSCGKTGHFIGDCPKHKKDKLGSTEKGKKPYEHKRRSKYDKKSYKKKHEVLLAEERKSKWAESDSDDSDPESMSCSSDDDEEVKCLMVDDTKLESTSQ
ncbi:uncharacterized protein [Primulina huaijiensis]|uniref:uncharacterized protein n=1 Tax=Primulina huaijiensis TaxID=1492673 RepID=UPI003CC72441